MAKKKISEVQKLKREVEALKAQVKAETFKIEKAIDPKVVQSQTSSQKKVLTSSEVNSARFTLPVKEIKHDLLRIAIFSVVSIGLVVMLGVLKVDVANILNNFPKF